MEQLDTFLARHAPFDGIAPAQLRPLLQAVEERVYEPGQTPLVEDGPPAAGLWVIRSGTMELVHDGEVIQVLERGECFGHTSLLTGMAPTFTVRARERSECVVLPATEARLALATESGVAFVAETMRRRMIGTGHTVHGLLDVGTTPVSSIMRAAVFCDPDSSLRDAAARLSEPGVSSLLVRLGEEQLGIVTDAEIRAAIAGERGALDVPVRQIARTPVPSVGAGELAVEATVDMLAAGSAHLAVLDQGRVCGVIASADLLGLDADSPIALRHVILGAGDEDELIGAVSQLSRLFLLLVRAGVPARDLGRVLSLQHDAVVTRLAEFSIARAGPPPLPWAWLDLGSAARREFTLASDQDNALAYGNPDGTVDADTIDAYFARLGADINAGLARCGIGVDNNGVLASKPLWRMAKQTWLATFDECLHEPDESHLIRATVAFDFRPAAGGLVLTAELAERIRAARGYPQFMRLMARSAAGFPVAIGFRGQLATGRGGDPPGKLDLKRGAIIPLVNLVRFHALANGVTISSTLDRIEAVAGVGGLRHDIADALAEAFALITRVRFEHHAARIAQGAAADNLIDPSELPPIARADLREALLVVRRAQKQIGAWAPGGR